MTRHLICLGCPYQNGRKDRIWTCNPLVPNQVLYQVEPLPDMVRSKGFEPLTFWFVAKHSIQLSYERKTCCLATFIVIKLLIKWWLQRESNQRHRDFQSLALPTELSGQNCGSRIWTYDLRVMSPTSYLAAPSRDLQIYYNTYFYICQWFKAKIT